MRFYGDWRKRVICVAAAEISDCILYIFMPRPEHKLPTKINMFWQTLIQGLTYIGMAGTGFTYV